MTGSTSFLSPLTDIHGSKYVDLISGNSLLFNTEPVVTHLERGLYENHLLFSSGVKCGLRPAGDIVVMGSESFCVECWFYIDPSGAPSIAYLVRLSDSNPTYARGFILAISGNVPFLSLGTGSSDLVVSSSSPISSSDGWVHLAATYDMRDKKPRIYINGSLVVTGSPVSLSKLTDSQVLNIGHDPSASSRDWSGGISDVRITRGGVRYDGLFTPKTNLATSLRGNAYREDGLEPKPSVLVRNCQSLHTTKLSVDEQGNWGGLFASDESYDVSYIADGAKPEIHGPYIY